MISTSARSIRCSPKNRIDQIRFKPSCTANTVRLLRPASNPRRRHARQPAIASFRRGLVHHALGIGNGDAVAVEGLLEEELEFIRADRSTETKRPQVRWEGEAARWYPIAARILRQLVVDPEPVEFATELLLPFTFDLIREAEDPREAVNEFCPGKYRS